LAVGIRIGDLAEESDFGHNARREIRRWFPRVTWVSRLDADAELRATYFMDRRRFLQTMGLVSVAPAVSVACTEVAAQLLFIAIEMAAKYYLGQSADGSAVFGSSSPSREIFQLVTKLVLGKPSSGGELKDQRDYEVSVPAGADDYSYFFSGLMSGDSGEHYVEGKARGDTQLSNPFAYEAS
jgi:hypothetical protein